MDDFKKEKINYLPSHRRASYPKGQSPSHHPITDATPYSASLWRLVKPQTFAVYLHGREPNPSDLCQGAYPKNPEDKRIHQS